MCTVTWFRQHGGYQLWFNRDERRARKPAVPAAIRRKGSTRFIAPLEGDFGGTWIGVNDRGLTLGLLNGYAGDDAIEPPGGYTSRGLLLTALIDASSIEQLERRLRRRDLAPFRSFLLFGVAPSGHGYLGRWRDGSLDESAGLDPDLPLVSSSFDGDSVRRGRIELFGRMKREWRGATADLHRDYHASHLPRRGPYSVCMHRDDARTVSVTHVRVDDHGIALLYSPHSPCAGWPREEPLKIERDPASIRTADGPG